jgi:hypothetical protein
MQNTGGSKAKGQTPNDQTTAAADMGLGQVMPEKNYRKNYRKNTGKRVVFLQ